MGRGSAFAAVILAALLGGTGLAGAETLAPSGGERVRLAYTVYVGLFPALDVTVALEASAERYRVDARVAPQVWIAWALPWQARSEAAGRRPASGMQVQPEGYHATASWGVRMRGTILSYGGDGRVSVTLEPPGDNEDREPVPASLIGDSLDPVSAVFGVLAAVGSGQGCPQRTPVFDGRRRFDILADSLPKATLAAGRYSAYGGPAAVCRLQFRSLAGGWKDGERARFWQTETPGSERPPIDLWLARLRDDTLPVPVFVSGSSILGSVTVYLSSYAFEPVGPIAVP